MVIVIWEVEPCVSNLGGLDHELSDVSKQSALAKVDFSEGDGGEESREDQMQARYDFACEGLGFWQGRPAWVVHISATDRSDQFHGHTRTASSLP